MDWIKKHSDTVAILTAIFGLFFWIDGKFERIDQKFAHVDDRFALVDKEIAKINQDVAIIKTVLIMKQVIPTELSACKEECK